MFNPNDIKKDFPLFNHYPKLIFADNASTTQKPKVVINAISEYYEKYNSNVHRAVYKLGIFSNEIYAKTKSLILDYCNLSESEYSCIFTAGTTDGFNKLSHSIESRIVKGDNIIVSEMEHHSNILPWQELCRRVGAELRYINITDEGELDYDHFQDLLDSRTKLVSITHISNTLGTKNDLKQIKSLLENYNADLIIDAAQSASFYADEFKSISADAYIFGAHKMFGPSGIGCVVAKNKFLEILPAFNYGGGMVYDVEKIRSSYKKDTTRFEGGTPPLAQLAGFAASLKYLQSLDIEKCRKHISKLSTQTRKIIEANGFKCLGSLENNCGILSVDFGNIHPHDVATFLNDRVIAVRAGHHCTQLLMKRYNLHSSVRFSFSIYNLEEEIEKINSAITDMISYFK